MMVRRLYRSDKQKVFMGVSGGLAEYFDVDPTIVRLVFIILTLINGLGILIYLIMALVVPRESTLESVSRNTVKENVKDLGQTASEVTKEVKEALQRKKDNAEESEDEGADVSAEKIDGGNELEEKEPPVDTGRRSIVGGAILVILGIIFIARNMGLFWWFDWGFFLPLLLILLGLSLIWRGKKVKQ